MNASEPNTFESFKRNTENYIKERKELRKKQYKKLFLPLWHADIIMEQDENNHVAELVEALKEANLPVHNKDKMNALIEKRDQELEWLKEIKEILKEIYAYRALTGEYSWRHEFENPNGIIESHRIQFPNERIDQLIKELRAYDEQEAIPRAEDELAFLEEILLRRENSFVEHVMTVWSF